MKKKVFVVIVFMLVLGILQTGCGKIDKQQKKDEVQKWDGKISVWATYWDVDRVYKEVGDLEDHIKNFSYFAAYFDNKNQLILPKATTQTFKMIEKIYDDNQWNNYLTIVNDKIKVDGSSSLKDTGLLYQLFSREEDMDQHIAEILSLTKTRGYDGIEIDYEALRDDMNLWSLYEKFIGKLFDRASKMGLKMRVVLEPSAPIEKLTLPEGPQYIMMCYNLHGLNTKPGPKADMDFIGKMIQKMSSVPGSKEFALATGGFDWREDGKTESITELQAEELVKKYNANVERDIDSMSLKFTYQDRKGLKHEVWYADMVTIRSWLDVILKSGESGISLWRLGGNNTSKR